MAVVALSMTDQDEARTLNDGVDQRRYSRMEERGISYGGAYCRIILARAFKCMIEPGSLADGCAHAKHRVDGAQIQPECVAADIARDKSLWEKLSLLRKMQPYGGILRKAWASCREKKGHPRHCGGRKFEETNGQPVLDQLRQKFSC